MAIKLVDKSTRFYNFIIDSILSGFLYLIIMISFMLILTLIEEQDKISLIEIVAYPVSYFCYYFFFEFLSGRTPGKKITKSVVVREDGGKPRVQDIFIRSILRMFPLDGLSYLFGSNIGIHDLLSNTRVIEKQGKTQIALP